MRKIPIVTYTVTLICFVKNIATEEGCSFSTDAVGDIQPLYLNQNFEFFEPDNGTIKLSTNETLIISCADEKNYLEKNINAPFINVSCSEKKNFQFNKKEVTIAAIRCTKDPQHIARDTRKLCAQKWKRIEIGFEIGDKFVKTIDVCFDPNLQTTVYTNFIMSPSASKSKVSAKSTAWRSDSFYDLNKRNANDLYTKESQRKQINTLLALGPDERKIINDKNELYLARGHLAAQADFFYGNQQKSTFHLVNAAPQWQSFNNANWRLLERSIRKLASSSTVPLVIYTGTYKILTKRNNNTQSDVNLSLFSMGNDVGLPVPLFFWKIVFNKKKGAGVAFVGVNDPYLSASDIKNPKYRLCADISEQIKWVSFNNNNLQRGFSYACTVNDFQAEVNYVPKLNVNSILL